MVPGKINGAGAENTTLFNLSGSTEQAILSISAVNAIFADSGANGANDIKSFSVNAGGKWTAFNADRWGKVLQGLFRKGGTLHLANGTPKEIKDGTKVTDYTTIEFAAIEAAGALRAAPNYLPLASTDGSTPGNWIPFARDALKGEGSNLVSNSLIAGTGAIELEYLYWPGVKKIADIAGSTNAATGFASATKEWKPITTEGLPISAEVRENGRAQNATYFVRIPASNAGGKFTAPGREVRINVAGPGRALNVRPNYKTDILRVKANTRFTLDGTTWQLFEKSTAITGIADDKGNVAIGEFMGTSISVFAAATSRRPASVVTRIDLAPRAAAPAPGDITANAKFNRAQAGTGVQLRANADAKWGRNVPLTVGTATAFSARKLGDAKAKKVELVSGVWVVGFEGNNSNGATATVTPVWGGTTEAPSVTFTVGAVTGFTVSFDAGEGTGTIAPLANQTSIASAPATTGFTAPTDKVFKHWSLTEGGAAISFPYTVTANVTFYAIWEDEEVVTLPTCGEPCEAPSGKCEECSFCGNDPGCYDGECDDCTGG
jgi:hypothetical protein